jgi:drug/metabolite transporter (DMT)-like permease
VRGFWLALSAAVLFGAAAPAAKPLLATLTPVQLAGLLYLGAALGIAPGALRGRAGRPALDRPTRARLAGIVVFGGILGPVLLLLALRSASAGSVSLLLNFELPATAVVGMALFGEGLGRRGALGVAGVVLAGAILSSHDGWPGARSATLVVAACACWGFDNNLTALIDAMTPSETTLWKTTIAGTTNLALGLALAPLAAPPAAIARALAIGALAYGASIALYVAAAQAEGAIRSQTVFAAAPFVGAVLAWAGLGEPATPAAVVAGLVFVAGVALLLSDRHAHAHVHEATAHLHSHRHDDGHHTHLHPGHPAATRHTHWHEHGPLEHSHPHGSDLHHRHGHRR